MLTKEVEMTGAIVNTTRYTHTIGERQYELSNHLGNVLAVVTDKKIARDDDQDGNIDYYQPDLLVAQDYSPFGVLLENRNWQSEEYRYSFQKQESDDEIKGKGNSINFKYRMYDPRLGRFPSLDPLASKYPHYTPYSFSGNKVIANVELEGLEEFPFQLLDDAMGLYKSTVLKGGDDDWLVKEMKIVKAYAMNVTIQGKVKGAVEGVSGMIDMVKNAKENGYSTEQLMSMIDLSGTKWLQDIANKKAEGILEGDIVKIETANAEGLVGLGVELKFSEGGIIEVKPEVPPLKVENLDGED